MTGRKKNEGKQWSFQTCSNFSEASTKHFLQSKQSKKTTKCGFFHPSNKPHHTLTHQLHHQQWRLINRFEVTLMNRNGTFLSVWLTSCFTAYTSLFKGKARLKTALQTMAPFHQMSRQWASLHSKRNLQLAQPNGMWSYPMQLIIPVWVSCCNKPKSAKSHHVCAACTLLKYVCRFFTLCNKQSSLTDPLIQLWSAVISVIFLCSGGLQLRVWVL